VSADSKRRYVSDGERERVAAYSAAGSMKMLLMWLMMLLMMMVMAARAGE